MYYFNVSMMRNEAVMPRILAEDTGAAELRDPMFCAKTAFKFRRPGWLHRKKASPAPCACPDKHRHPGLLLHQGRCRPECAAPESQRRRMRTRLIRTG